MERISQQKRRAVGLKMMSGVRLVANQGTTGKSHGKKTDPATVGREKSGRTGLAPQGHSTEKEKDFLTIHRRVF